MKKILVLLCLILILCSFASCSSEASSFCIQFLDVGQGDSALIECDGRYMLIDGGDKGHGEVVSSALESNKVAKLDYLVLTHLHDDHVCGLKDSMKHVISIGMVLCNTNNPIVNGYEDFQHDVSILGGVITVPKENAHYSLGSADIEVLSNGTENEDNASIVLLVTYGKMKFLFTGDMPDKVATELCDKYNDELEITLLKVPHHGGHENYLYRFIRMTNPKYAVISVGVNNRYGHPDDETLNLLNENSTEIYRTDLDGSITVKANGEKKLIINTVK